MWHVQKHWALSFFKLYFLKGSAHRYSLTPWERLLSVHNFLICAELMDLWWHPCHHAVYSKSRPDARMKTRNSLNGILLLRLLEFHVLLALFVNSLVQPCVLVISVCFLSTSPEEFLQPPLALWMIGQGGKGLTAAVMRIMRVSNTCMSVGKPTNTFWQK